MDETCTKDCLHEWLHLNWFMTTLTVQFVTRHWCLLFAVTRSGVSRYGHTLVTWRPVTVWRGGLARDRGTLWKFSWFPLTFTPNAFYSTALFITCGLELSSNSLFTAASHYTQLNTRTALEIICFSGEHVSLFRGWIQPFMHEFLSIVLKRKVLYSHTQSYSWINSSFIFLSHSLCSECVYLPVWQECWKCKLGKLNDVRDCFWKAKTYWELKCVLGI